MIKKSKRSVIGMLILLTLAANIYLGLGNKPVYANKIKKRTCETIGCPDTDGRLCGYATIGVGAISVKYVCYESIPLWA